MKKILIILPTYNEAANITPLIKRIFKTFNGSKTYSPEILVVDDDSPDKTAQKVIKLQSTNRSIHLTSGQKQGLGLAYTRGYQYAMQLGEYFAFITMDADFSHDPASIPSLLAKLENGADCAIGSRYTAGGGTSDSWPLRRLLQSRLANFLAKELAGLEDGVKDLTSGFRAIKPKALAKISLESIPASGYVYLVNILHELSKQGFKIEEAPIIFDERRHGKSKLKFRDMLEFLLLSYRLNPASRGRRILRFALVGLCGTFVNLAVLAAAVNLLKVSPILAVALAIEISIISNFFMNHLYTFRFRLSADSDLAVKLIKYNVVAVVGAAISFGLFSVTYKIVGLHYIVADLIAIGLTMFWNYAMSLWIVWKVVDKDSNKDMSINDQPKTAQIQEEYETIG